MKIKEIIDFIEQDSKWVDWNQTRDRLLIGDEHQIINKIGVCWVLTNQVIKIAIEKQINFIITHENPFYLASTCLSTNMYDAIEKKKKKLIDANITVYRCHDNWDLMPEYGIADVWVKKLNPLIQKIERKGFISLATIQKTQLRDIAKILSLNMIEDGENGVYIIGNELKNVKKVALGTGAATDVLKMAEYNPDVFIVSEDGINCWSSAQYAVDQGKALIVVSHCCCEKAGLKQMPMYIKKYNQDIQIEYIDDGMNAIFVAID